MENKKRIMEMYITAAEHLKEAVKKINGTEPGSEERDHAERLYGERQAYGRILKEIYGIPGVELQKLLDSIHANK